MQPNRSACLRMSYTLGLSDCKHAKEFLERHRRAPTIVTSNRAIGEWIPLFEYPILAQSELDRLAHNAYQVVMEGESFRKRQRPGESNATVPLRKPRSRRRRVA